VAGITCGDYDTLVPEWWINPLSMQPQKALDAIGKALQAQYERWQPRAKYKLQLDPTVEVWACINHAMPPSPFDPQAMPPPPCVPRTLFLES